MNLTLPIRLINIARYLTGLVFIFSGFIKANDPLGFAYKLEEYFVVFGIDFLQPLSVTLAILLCGIEIILGAFLLLGFWRKTTVWGLLLLIIFFTFLTFYSAYFDAVKSCGCFGDAIPLTPWQSFYKDLGLLVLIGIIFINREKLQPVSRDRYTENIVTAAIVVIAMGIGVYTYNFLPFFDFLPYKKGNNLPALMEIPDGAVLDEYETIYQLKHSETGEVKEMNDKAYIETGIWKDGSWEIVGTPETRLIKAGFQPLIYDLLISDVTGVDRTKELLNQSGYNLIIVAYDMAKSNEGGLEEIARLTDSLKQSDNISTVLITSSSEKKANHILDKLGLSFDILFADAVPLKSMVRANPGLLLMRDGTVIQKWHYHVIPSIERFKTKYIHAK